MKEKRGYKQKPWDGFSKVYPTFTVSSKKEKVKKSHVKNSDGTIDVTTTKGDRSSVSNYKPKIGKNKKTYYKNDQGQTFSLESIKK